MIRNNLSKILGEKRLTQKELSELTGIRRQTISDLYHEINISIGVNNLDKLCEILDCSVAELIVYVPNKSRQK